MMTSEQLAAINLLLASGVTQKEVAAALASRSNAQQHAAEDAKAHALDSVELTDEQWDGFFAHLLDGGGAADEGAPIDDGPSLRDRFHGAIINRDRKATMHLMPHLLKSLLKRTGARRVLQPGFVSAGPVQMTPAATILPR